MLDYLLTWLCTFGVAFPVALTHGPFDLFRLGRSVIARRYPAKWVRAGVSCPVCLSCYAGLVFAIVFQTWIPGWISAVGFTSVVVALSPD